MIAEIRREIESLEQGATRLAALAANNPAVRKNAEIILTFVYILKFITPDRDEWSTCKQGMTVGDVV